MPPDFSVVSMLARASSNREPVTCTAGPIAVFRRSVSARPSMRKMRWGNAVREGRAR